MSFDVELVRLAPLMARTSGKPEMVIGLIDGPVALDHPGLAADNVRSLSDGCTAPASAACRHGTFIAGVLAARRGSAAPAICPDCTLLVRPIFAERAPAHDEAPSTTPAELAAAIVECVRAGALILNLSAALSHAAARHEGMLTQALDYAASRGVIVVAAAGNQGEVGGSAITRHPWVVAVIACNPHGMPTARTNLGASIGRHGLGAPGEAVTSQSSDRTSTRSGGTSVAAPFVTGAIALAWSERARASAIDVRLAVTRAHPRRARAVVPPLLDAMALHAAIAA
jgi:subtilisin family serine protease